MLISKVSKLQIHKFLNAKEMISEMRNKRETEALSDFHGLDMNVKTGITEKIDNLILKNTLPVSAPGQPRGRKSVTHGNSNLGGL